MFVSAEAQLLFVQIFFQKQFQNLHKMPITLLQTACAAHSDAVDTLLHRAQYLPHYCHYFPPGEHYLLKGACIALLERR